MDDLLELALERAEAIGETEIVIYTHPVATAGVAACEDGTWTARVWLRLPTDDGTKIRDRVVAEGSYDSARQGLDGCARMLRDALARHA